MAPWRQEDVLLINLAAQYERAHPEAFNMKAAHGLGSH